MSVAIWFWVIFVIGLLFFGFSVYQDRTTFSISGIFWWVLIFLLGVGVFGSPIK